MSYYRQLLVDCNSHQTQIHVHANTVSRIIGKMSIFKTFKQFVTVWQLLRMITQIVASYPFSSISLQISLSIEIFIYNL